MLTNLSHRLYQYGGRRQNSLSPDLLCTVKVFSDYYHYHERNIKDPMNTVVVDSMQLTDRIFCLPALDE